MSAPQSKIITKLLERRQIEARLREMLEATTNAELRRHAQQIASLGAEVLPTILGNLDGANDQMVAAMGMVALYLDREEAVEGLRAAVLAPRLTDQGRVGAMTILHRFLGVDPEEQLLESLDNPEEVILSSLKDVLQQATRDPGVLVPYVEALDRQEPDRVLAVVQTLAEVAHSAGPSSSGSRGALRGGMVPEGVVALLRMMAQDVRKEVAAAVLETLGTVRLGEAARALQGLLPATAMYLRPLVERNLRKLQFSGVEVSPLPPPDASWRALVSPPGGRGEQSVWFIFPQEREREARFLNILLHERAGAVHAVGHPRVPTLMLPPRRRVGHVHDVALPDGSGVMLALEVSFDLGRRLVRDALARNRETQIPVAGSLRLSSPWLWEVAWTGGSLLPRVPDLERAEEADLVRRSADLLGLPAFQGWSLRGEPLLRAAEDVLRNPEADLERWIRRLADELFASPELVQAFQQRLTAMSEWLLLSGDRASSRQALAAASSLLSHRVQMKTFIEALVRRDLQIAKERLQQQAERAKRAKGE